MPKYVFENCCICIDLRVGCFIIGYLNAIGSVISIISAVLAVVSGALLVQSTDPDLWSLGNFILPISIITLITVIVLFGFSIVLLVGLHKNKPRHVLVFIQFSVVYLVVSFILFIVNIALGSSTWYVIFTGVLGTLFNIYNVLVIRSYYYKMLEAPSTVISYNS